MHIRPHQDDLVATLIGTVVRLQLRQDRVTVEPVVNAVTRLLLLVE